MSELTRMLVWKFELEVVDEQEIGIPPNAKVLHVEAQGSSLCMWCLVDPTKRPLPTTVWITGTGRPVPQFAVHLGTAQVRAMVWHVWGRSGGMLERIGPADVMVD